MSLLPLMYPVDAESTELNSCLAHGTMPLQRAPFPKIASEVELAEVMRDLGYSCCANAKCFGEVLALFGPLDVSCVGAMVAVMACTAIGLDDSLSLHGAFSTAVSGKYLEFDAKFDADNEDAEVTEMVEHHFPVE